MADELAAQGADDDAIAAFLDASLDDDPPDEPLYLWPENATAFRVFAHCEWTRQPLSTMDSARVIYTGISATEVHDTCVLLGVPAAEWPDVLAKVRIAVATALPLLNAEA